MTTFLRLLFGGLETGSFYALAALGIVIIFRTSRATNFAQGSIGMFNAFLATVLLINHGIPTWFAVIIGMIAAFIMGIVIDLLIIRQAKKANIVSKQIITFGLILVLLGLAPMIFGSVPLSFPRMIPDGQFQIADAGLTYNALLNMSLGVVIMIVLLYFLQYTKWGLAVRVTASNPATARLMGVPTSFVTMGAWAIAAALGALSALMLAPNFMVDPSMMEDVQLNALLAGVIGGFQTFHGPVIAAYLIAVLRNLLLYYVSPVWGNSIIFLLILIFIVVRPNGLIGKKIVKKV